MSYGDMIFKSLSVARERNALEDVKLSKMLSGIETSRKYVNKQHFNLTYEHKKEAFRTKRENTDMLER